MITINRTTSYQPIQSPVSQSPGGTESVELIDAQKTVHPPAIERRRNKDRRRRNKNPNFRGRFLLECRSGKDRRKKNGRSQTSIDINA